MPYQIENKMVVDAAWSEIEYGVKHKTPLERQQDAYEEAEREDNYGYII